MLVIKFLKIFFYNFIKFKNFNRVFFLDFKFSIIKDFYKSGFFL